MLIQAYGEYWTPDAVNWGRRGGTAGSLPGVACPPKASKFDVDAWNAMAVYVLWSDYAPVYIGKTQASHGLGPRMRNHLADRLAKRWDLFSWYSLSKPLRSGTMRDPGGRHVEPTAVLAAFEAFGQRLELPLNRRQETIPSAIRVEQRPVPTSEPLNAVIDRLAQLERRLSSIEKKL